MWPRSTSGSRTAPPKGTPRTCPSLRNSPTSGRFPSRIRSSTWPTSRTTSRPKGRSNTSALLSIRAGPRTSGSRRWNAGRAITAIVHHIIVYVIPPGVAPKGRAGRLQTNWLGAFAPGLRQEPLPDGYARYVQKGSKLLFEVHYTPNGVAQTDRSFAGFVFADPATVKNEVAVQNAGNFTFKIPPQDSNYEVESEFVFRQNATLLTISPHMHVRGKDFFYELIYPDGKKETLLWVPRYDFGWQTTYWLTEPKQIPARRKDALRGSLRQLARQSGQSRSECHGSLGRADLGRDDVRLVRNGPDGSGPDRAGH